MAFFQKMSPCAARMVRAHDYVSIFLSHSTFRDQLRCYYELGTGLARNQYGGKVTHGSDGRVGGRDAPGLRLRRP